MKNKNLVLSLFLTGFVFYPLTAKAVIPPDFIFNIGTQVIQIFSVVIVFMATAFSMLSKFLRSKLESLKNKKLFFILAISLAIIVSLFISYYYALYRQKVEYNNWLEESREHAFSQEDTDQIFDNESVRAFNSDENDKLNIGVVDTKAIADTAETFVSRVEPTDSVSMFIKNYYENIATGNYDTAYEMSKKSVDFETFKSWYAATTKIRLDKLVRISDTTSSVELTLYEGDAFFVYGVLMTLRLQNGTPLTVDSSEVKVLSQGIVSDDTVLLNENLIGDEYGFFDEHKETNVSVSNEEFNTIISGDSENYMVLDVREDLEYNNGFFPGSSHVRFADLKAGGWIDVPHDVYVYVICWSGIRGKEVAEFLRSKKVVARYLENGAKGWVDGGGIWTGSIDFSDQYDSPRYKRVFSSEEVKQELEEGVLLVDSREPYRYQQSHISGSINISTMYTPTIKLEEMFGQIPAGSRVITVCDDYVNCFDAKITGIEVEARGHQFLGRYNKPWEYEY